MFISYAAKDCHIKSVDLYLLIFIYIYLYLDLYFHRLPKDSSYRDKWLDYVRSNNDIAQDKTFSSV